MTTPNPSSEAKDSEEHFPEWHCVECGWKGFILTTTEAVEYHKRFHSKQGSKCKGSIEKYIEDKDLFISQLGDQVAELKKENEELFKALQGLYKCEDNDGEEMRKAKAALAAYRIKTTDAGEDK